MLRWISREFAERDAMVRNGRRISFSDLERRSAVVSRGLLALGLGKGSRIALLLPNSPEFVIYLMAAGRIGAVVTPLSTLSQAPELAWVLGHGDIQLLVTCDRYLGHNYLDRIELAFPEIRGQSFGRIALKAAPYLRSVLVWGQGAPSWAAPAESTLLGLANDRPEIDEAFLEAVESNVVEADSFCVIYTSGSTAAPKGVVHGQGPWVRHTYQMAHDYSGASDGDRIVSARPFFWVAGLSATLFHSLHTGCCIIVPEDMTAATLQSLIDTEGATALCGDFGTVGADPGLRAAGYRIYRVASDYAAIAKAHPEGERFLNPSRAARDPVPHVLPSDLIARSFGMTETMGSHTSYPAESLLPPDRARTCGRAVPGVMLRVIDPQTRQPVPPGQLGELLVKGYSLTLGLYKKERADTFTAEGFYPTGDLVSMDDEGFVTFSSRIGEMVKIHGANVAPLEVETCLNSLPEIERSAVVGLDMGNREILLVAAVQPREGCVIDEASISAALRTMLSSFKVPKRFFPFAAEAFPRTASGKIKKSVLAEILAEEIRSETTAPAGS